MARKLDDGRPLKNMDGLRLGARVRMQGVQPELLLALMVLSDLCRVSATMVIVTAILNGKHMENSLHYVGAAIDFVVDLVVDHEPWVQELRDRLGPNYDVIEEAGHIHIEYQPHVGAVT